MLEVSDLRSQLISKLGVSAPEPDDVLPTPDDPLAADAHLNSEWLAALEPAAARAGIKLNPRPSLGAARQAHDLLAKRLKANGDKRARAALDELRGRYEKKREKLAWTRLKRTLEDAGVSAKLYRAIKSSKVGPEIVLTRWSRVKSKGLNSAQLRTELLGS